MDVINQPATPRTAQANIDAVMKLEQEALRDRTAADRISDAIANFVGSIPFVALHVIWFAIWAAVNCGAFGPSWKFDPYPFALLCMLVSLEGVLLSTFVLIKQNRMGRHAEQRNHLDLQINLLAEKEVTKVLQLQQLICKRLGIAEVEMDEEIRELSTVTAVDNLAHEVGQNMPKEV